jgi:purine nucleoside permease
MSSYIATFTLTVLLSFATATHAEKSYSTKHESVLRHFQSGAEPKVKDAIWTAEEIFKVGVIPDGTSRNGYADYVCEVLYDHGLKGKKVWVHVVDIVALKRTGKWVRLGESHCK